MGAIGRGTFVQDAISPGITGALPEDLSPFISMDLFPTVGNVKVTGSYYKVNTDDVQRITTDGIGDADDGFALDDFGMTTATFETHWRGSKLRITHDEKAQFGDAVARNLKERAAMSMCLRKWDKHWSAEYFKTGVWATDASAPSTKWDADGSDPIGDIVSGCVEPIQDYYDVVFSDTGPSGLIGICGKKTWSVLKNHDQFRDLQGLTLEKPRPATMSEVARAMNLDAIFVGGASEVTSAEGAATDTRSNIFGDGFLVLKVSQGPFNPASPTAGVTLINRPMVTSFFDNPDSRTVETEYVAARIRGTFFTVDTNLGAFQQDVLT